MLFVDLQVVTIYMHVTVYVIATCQLFIIKIKSIYILILLPFAKHMSRLMGKPTICIGESKDADQLRGNREADQRLCFRYSDSIIPLLLKSEISSFYLFSVTVQAGLCQTCSEATLLVFPRGGSYSKNSSEHCYKFALLPLHELD